MTTCADLIYQCRRRLLSDLREEQNLLSADITANATSLSTVYSLGSIRPGSIIAIDFELLYVLDNPTTSSVTVARGWLGSTAAVHSSQAVITVNPRFSDMDILNALNEDIDDLSSPNNGLFQMLEVTLTYNPAITGYDLTNVDPTTVLEIYEVRSKDYGPSRAWPPMPRSLWKLERQADTSIFPSGLSIKLHGESFPGQPVRVKYKAPFTTPLVNLTDDVKNVTGLHPQAHDIPVLGAAERLVAFRETKRSFTENQSDPRRAEEVPVGASATATKELTMLRERRIAAEAARLARIYPEMAR